MHAEKIHSDSNLPIIGVLDSGVGGLTVVSQLAKLLPGAKVLYFGDNANVPYGNRGEEEIFRLARRMFDFLHSRGAAAIAIACNTISTLTEKFQATYDFPIFSIIDPAAEYAAAHCPEGIGLIATEFTVKTAAHEKRIHAINPKIPVFGEGSARLAALIDSGEFDMTAIEADISGHLANLMARSGDKAIILGCTHYPLVLDVFQKTAPDIEFIDPAILQAQKVHDYVESIPGFGNQSKDPRFAVSTMPRSPRNREDAASLSAIAPLDLHIYTTGDATVYQIFLKKLGLASMALVEHATI